MSGRTTFLLSLMAFLLSVAAFGVRLYRGKFDGPLDMMISAVLVLFTLSLVWRARHAGAARG